MPKDSIKKEIEALREKIREHDDLYYVLNKPVILDQEYDKLYKRLKELEDAHPELIVQDSPTQRVGGHPAEGFAVVKHIVPMMSIDNTYSASELKEFDERVRKNLKGEEYEYVVELKFDGVSISLLYENGRWVRGATRGDGTQGDDVSNNLKTIRSMPLKFSTNVKKSPARAELRGEVYMTKDVFESINRAKKQSGEEPFANPRNAAAGSLKLLDPKVVAKRRLNIFIWGLGYCEGMDFEKHTDLLEYLKEAGFRVNSHFKLCKDIKDVIEFCNSWEGKRGKLEFEIDGMVVKVNDLKQRQILGSTSKSPRWAIAYKFPAEKALTEVENIIIQVGRTGTITPVAILRPVCLSGSTVSRATLHNFDEIERLDVKIGDKVYVEKSGEIIPKVLSVARKMRTGKEKSFPLPESCPACGSKLHFASDEVALRCENAGCPAQIKEKMLHFASRNAMDIEGMGTAITDQLVDKGLIKDYADIYYLKMDDIDKLDRMAKKSAANLLDAIEKSKLNDLNRLIYALGIRHAGEHSAWVLANHFGSIEKLSSAGVDELTSIDEIGPVMAESISDFFSNKENIRMLKRLSEAGVRFERNGTETTVGGVLEGKSVVITGTLKNYSRSQAEELVRKLGGNPASSVSKNTYFVVAGDQPGSKIDKAKALGIKIINEEEFRKIAG